MKHPFPTAALLATLALGAAGVRAGPAAPATPPPGTWQKAIQAFQAADLRQPPPADPILFVGSSSFAWWHTLAADMKPLVALNRGFGGSTTADVLTYYDWVIRPYKPRLLVIYEGGNDVAGGRSPEAVVAQMETLVDRVREDFPGIPCLFVTVRPSRARWQLAIDEGRVNRLMLEMAERYPGVGFVNGNRVLFDERGEPDSRRLGPDGLHLSADGNRAWCGVLKPAIEKALAGTVPRPEGLERLRLTTFFAEPVYRGETCTLEFPVINKGKTTLRWRATWESLGTGAEVTPKTVEELEVPAGETRTVRFSIRLDTHTAPLPFLAWTATAGEDTVRGQAALVALPAGRYGRDQAEAEKFPLVANSQSQVKTFGTGAWGGPADCSAAAWVARQADGVRVHVEVTDDTFQGGGAQPWDNDAVELHFDFRPADKRTKELRTAGCIQFIAVPAAANDGPGSLHAYGPTGDLKVAGTRMTSARREKGYWVEVFLPWTSLRDVGIEPAGEALIFTYAVDDIDAPGPLRQQLRWGGLEADHQRPGLWGRLLPPTRP